MDHGSTAKLLLAAVLLLVMTNPGASRHEKAIYDRFEASLTDLVEQRAGESSHLLAVFFGRLTTELAADLDQEMFRYRDYHLFSVMTMGHRVVSLGVLNRVYVSRALQPADVFHGLAEILDQAQVAPPPQQDDELSRLTVGVLELLVSP